ncbi:hypothetical protein HDU93_001672, partial [Gonapodya sp. JEL0774]
METWKTIYKERCEELWTEDNDAICKYAGTGIDKALGPAQTQYDRLIELGKYMTLAHTVFSWSKLHPEDVRSDDMKKTLVITPAVKSRQEERAKHNASRFVFYSKQTGHWTPYYVIFTSKDAKDVTIVVRGSEEINDWFTDFSVGLSPNRVHSGFLKAAETILFESGHNVWAGYALPALQNGGKVKVIGHSLGAAVTAYLIMIMASLGGEYVSDNPDMLQGFAFAPPPCVPPCMEDIVAPHCTCIVYYHDIVPHARYTTSLTLPGENKVVYLAQCGNKVIPMHREARSFTYHTDMSPKFHHPATYEKAIKDAIATVKLSLPSA